MVRVQKRISIVLVDDTPPAPEVPVGLILARAGFRVRAVSAKLETLVGTLRETPPDLVVLNLARRGSERLTFAGTLHREAPDLPMIIMGLSRHRENVEGLVRAGVAGFIMANAPSAACLSTILLVANGVRVLPPDLTHALFLQLRRRRTPPVSPSFRPLAALAPGSSVLHSRS